MKNPKKNKNFSALVAKPDATRVNNTMLPIAPSFNLPLVNRADTGEVGIKQEMSSGFRIQEKQMKEMAELMMPFMGVKLVKGSKQFKELMKSIDEQGSEMAPTVQKVMKKYLTNFIENPDKKSNLINLKNINKYFDRSRASKIIDDLNMTSEGKQLTPTGMTGFNYEKMIKQTIKELNKDKPNF